MSRRVQPAFLRLALAAVTLLPIQLIAVRPAAAAATSSPAAAAAASSPQASVAGPSPAMLAAYTARMRSYRIVGAARAQQGKPYRYGAAGPAAFDCSGLTGYAYRTQHLTLPRTADQQYRATRRIAAPDARPGDLVFWVSGGHAYHVAIYAGNGTVWHAPKPGSRVHSANIWSSSQVRFGRIGR